jgi:hypothetical protein
VPAALLALGPPQTMQSWIVQAPEDIGAVVGHIVEAAVGIA